MSPDDTARTPDDDLDRLMQHAVPGEFSFFGRQKEQQPAPLTGIEPGRVIDDFKLIAPIGQGGMGQVWEAEQVSLNRRVALKLVRPDRVNEHTLDLFSREARAGGRLSHPGIVTVYGHGEAEGVAWISMELVEGAWTLKDFIEETSRKGELPDGYYKRVAELVAALADALQAAHEANVIHRDLKPANVLITPDEYPKVTDFGLAKITDETALSVTGDFAGTYAYMSPEQAMASRMGLDHRTDVFSLGVMLYELLALRRPFEGDTAAQVAQQIVTEDPVDLNRLRSRIPVDMAVIASKCLEKSPDRRYQTMAELAADIRRHLANEPILAKPPTALQRASKWVRRHPTQSVVAGVILLALGIVTVLSVALAEEVASVNRLAALQDYDDLIADAKKLWPAHREKIPQLEAWVDRAHELLDNLPQYKLELVARESSTREVDRWWRIQMRKLVSSLEALSDPETGILGRGIHPDDGWGVGRRIDFADHLASAFEPGGIHEVRWRESLPSIARAYPDLNLSQQVGLVPIDPDPDSGLWEFWHVATGEEPVRGEDGKLVLTEDMGLVFVLLRGGKYLMGAQASNPQEPNYDRQATPFEGPVHDVKLSPFFLSKYEMTQGQWQRCAGQNPSGYTPERYKRHNNVAGLPGDLLHPVEQVSWSTCTEVLDRLGLVLPTEAEWEYGARGGTPSVWWPGDEKEFLPGTANLKDRYAQGHGGAFWRYWEDWDDGNTTHARVGSYTENAFGLFDVIGNVLEWCRDGRDTKFYGSSPLKDPVADQDGTPRRMFRGGSYYDAAVHSRSASRDGGSTVYADNDLGLRPARAITK